MDIYLLFWLAMVVFFVFVALLIVGVMSGSNNELQSTSARAVKRVEKGWQSWIGFVGISLVIAMWTLWGALFYLTVIWLLRQNPEPDASFTLSDSEGKTTKIIYG